MSAPAALEHRSRLPFRRRPLPWSACLTAALLCRVNPDRLTWVMRTARRGARPARLEEARRARSDVLSVSLACAGQACLQRSVATALLCRARGSWPTWIVGVQNLGQVRAHAWVCVDGRPVDEPSPLAHLVPLIEVGPTR
ncbi:MAG TPA: lasso peptide biosynthesis B2 protein [Jatrophihabitantaceae bacterium]|nr:lasso peptide biosynthesis B2 protein [Jatrophihabitantaceae bacterium]